MSNTNTVNQSDVTQLINKFDPVKDDVTPPTASGPKVDCGIYITCVNRNGCPLKFQHQSSPVYGSWGSIFQSAKRISECKLFVIYLDDQYMAAIQKPDLTNFTKMEFQLARLHCKGRIIIVSENEEKYYTKIPFHQLKVAQWVQSSQSDIEKVINKACPSPLSTSTTNPDSYVDTLTDFKTVHDLYVQQGTDRITLTGFVVSGSPVKGLGIFCNASKGICYSGPFSGNQPLNGLFRIAVHTYYEYWEPPTTPTSSAAATTSIAITRSGLIMYWENDDIFYFGEWKDDKRHGKGYFENKGDYYDGDWKEDQMEGTGQYGWLVQQSGGAGSAHTSYHGLFRQNQPIGTGTYTWPDGTTLQGEFTKGSINVKKSVTIKYPNGATYTGMVNNQGQRDDSSGTYNFDADKKFQGRFKDDVPEGQGSYTDKSGASSVQYVGPLNQGNVSGKGNLTVDGNKINGVFINGKLDTNQTVEVIYSNGDKFEGFVDDQGKKNGPGKYTWYLGGTVYQGAFVDDQMEGAGELTWASRETFKGEFKNGHFQKGTLTYDSGKNIQYTGEFNDHNQRHGKGKMVYDQKNSFDGTWEQDKRADGTFTGKNFTYTGTYDGNEQRLKGLYDWGNGATYDGEFQANNRHGTGKMTYQDKSVYTGLWDTDKRVSMTLNPECDAYQDTDVSKTIPSIGSDVAEHVFEPGNVVYRGQFTDDKIEGQGVLTEYTDHSQNIKRHLFAGTFVNNQISGHGAYVEFDENGKEKARYIGDFNQNGCAGSGKRYTSSSSIAYTCQSGKIVLVDQPNTP